MNEDFLHYVWKFQKFHTVGLCTTLGESLRVRKTGIHNTDAGPDFLCGEVVIDGQLWAGMIEIHLRSSHWYLHQHETDKAYDNVILHVVWDHDSEVYRNDETPIPVLELKDRVPVDLLANYYGLFSKNNRWINCEQQLGEVGDTIFQNWLDRMYLERLQARSELIQLELEASQNDWQAVLFMMLCKNFGLKVNGDSFLSIARSVDHSVVKKCRQQVEWMEALLLGQAGFLEKPSQDSFHKSMLDNYDHLKLKYKCSQEGVVTPKFFRLRPANFPTLRLSQFAVLWCGNSHLFSELMAAKTLHNYYKLLQVSASDYWDTHYNFGTTSAKRKKKVSTNFMDLLLINSVIPLKHAHALYRGKDISEEIIDLTTSIKGEKNTVVSKFSLLRKFESNALHSQALLQLKYNYCDRNKCLQCAIGNALIKPEVAKLGSRVVRDGT